MKTAIVIPARLESRRLPRKLLLRETGKSLLQHTWERAMGCGMADLVIISTADHEIAAEAGSFGSAIHWSSPEATCGTDRVSEFSAQNPEYGIVINLQGDEPLMPVGYLEQLITMTDSCLVSVTTLACPVLASTIRDNLSAVKVVVADTWGSALYFSRLPIPYRASTLNHHFGVYGFSRHALQAWAKLPISKNEKAENLEQLRWLPGAIEVALVADDVAGINTRADYDAFKERIACTANA